MYGCVCCIADWGDLPASMIVLTFGPYILLGLSTLISIPYRFSVIMYKSFLCYYSFYSILSLPSMIRCVSHYVYIILNMYFV